VKREEKNLGSPERVTGVSSGHGREPGGLKRCRILLGTPQGSQGETPAIRNATQWGAGRGQRDLVDWSSGRVVNWGKLSAKSKAQSAKSSGQLAGGTTEGATLDSAQHDVLDAGQRSRTKCGAEDPGRSAGPKLPDEERKRIQARAAGHGQPGVSLRLIRLQRPDPGLRQAVFRLAVAENPARPKKRRGY